jgi:hypothetical protein
MHPGNISEPFKNAGEGFKFGEIPEGKYKIVGAGMPQPVYGMCTHGENMAACTQCNGWDSAYTAERIKTLLPDNVLKPIRMKLTVSQLRSLEKKTIKGEISYSRMVEIINEITTKLQEDDLRELKRIRAYFGRHDKTMYEHHAYKFLDKYIKNNSDTSTATESPLKSLFENECVPVVIIKFRTGAGDLWFNRKEWDDMGGYKGMLKTYRFSILDIYEVIKKDVKPHQIPTGEWEP